MSKIPPKSQPTLGLEVEDFERLGVRPDEMRLTVIRRAAMQTSRTLAENQLSNPSDTAALQLSRVTISAYRLLDPRQRGDVHQRIHVGRILPTVLMWAGQTKFQNQQAGGRKSKRSSVHASGAGNAEASTPFQGGGLSESDLIELMELDSTPLLAGQPAWAQSFSDVDILGRTSFLKHWNRWRRVLLTRWYAIGLAVILIVLFVFAFVFPGREKPLARKEVNRAPFVGARAVDSVKDHFDAYDYLGEPSVTGEQNVDLERGLGVLGEPDFDLADSLESDIQGTNPIVSLDSISETIVELENPVNDISVIDRSVKKSDEMTEAGSAVVERSGSDFLPDPFAAPSGTTATDLQNMGVRPDDDLTAASLAGLKQDEKMDVKPETGIKSEEATEAVPETVKQSVPDSEAVAKARKKIVSLDSISMAAGNHDDLVQRVVALDELRDSFRLGTPEYWAVSVLLIENGWQTTGVSDVSRTLVDLTQVYQLAPASLLVETYLAANVRSAVPETQRHLLANGLVLLDQLVIADQVELAMQILDSVASLSVTLEDSEAMVHVADYERVIVQTRRQGERFKLLLAEDPETWSRSTRGLLGRYYCFVLRRWDAGLPWLSSASDSRVASAATSELALSVNPSFEDLVALAKRWELNADRASGLNRESMRLHAVFLARKALRKASESQRLEFGVELGELSENLPEHLRKTGFQLHDATE
ncbi:MAG: hypothetical protein CBD74_07635 [Saprospirales bacterium TMED214]|nr:MAG: hypothetical protein CBD74_07635 [Saprospirales bacterium TMED214]